MRLITLRLGRLAAVAVAALFIGGLVPAASVQAAAPKVAIIVGPAGAAVTDRYRKAADAAAAVALTLTPNVVRVYSPNATWPAVRAAVTGASVVVYLGHGNGWPSPYGKTLLAKTMDGFGLNPVAGADDVAHQYFGESFVARLRLAPGAVVLLSHLCYASGATEPGLDDGVITDVVSRVDNFAAGFLAAGAGAVVAEGHENPDVLMSAALHGAAAVTRAWTSASWGHGNIASYASARTAGAVIALDPDKASGGYYRSLVRGSGGSGRGAVLGPNAVNSLLPTAPLSLASAGAKFGAAVVQNAVQPGASTSVQVPVTAAAAALPPSLLVGVRWLPLVASTPDPGHASSEDDLVVGEASDEVVETATATSRGGALELSVPTPTAPGTYVVLMTLEANDGTPYDVATQSLLRPFTVVVPKPIDLRITAPASIAAQPSSPLNLTVTLENTGTQAWGSSLYASMWADPALDPVLDRQFSSVLALNASWLNVATGVASPAATYPLPRALGAPGASTSVNLGVLSPESPGQYLLVLSLAVHGTLGAFPQEPLLVPALVGDDAPAPSAAPSAGPSVAPSASAVPGIASPRPTPVTTRPATSSESPAPTTLRPIP